MKEGWVKVTLNDIAKWGSGGTPKSTVPEYYYGDIPWLIIGDMNDGYISDSEKHITELGLKNSSAKIVEPESVLIAMYGSIGKLGINKVHVATNQAIAFTQILYKSTLNKYLFYYLLLIRPKLYKLGKGGTQINISQTVLKKVEFPLSPLPEQRAIVIKIEQLYSDLDKGIENLKKAQEQLKIYRQAVLKKAFEGELTKEWREKQTDLPTGETLLNEIKIEFDILEKEKKKKKEKQLPSINNKDIPHKIPKEWIWCNLGQVTWFINGDRGKNYPNKSEYVTEGIPWINTGHIEPDGSLSKERMNFITREKYDSLRSGKIGKNDLVYCLRGATFGKTAFVKPYEEGSIASSLMIIRSNEKINKKFLYRFLTSVEGKNQLLRFDNGSAQPNLSANMVRLYAYPLPSIIEQNQIVFEIENRLSVCDKLEESIKESLLKAEALRQSILKKAFEGKLLNEQEQQACGQEPDWEPAEKLLERIKNENITKNSK